MNEEHVLSFDNRRHYKLNNETVEMNPMKSVGRMINVSKCHTGHTAIAKLEVVVKVTTHDNTYFGHYGALLSWVHVQVTKGQLVCANSSYETCF